MSRIELSLYEAEELALVAKRAGKKVEDYVRDIFLSDGDMHLDGDAFAPEGDMHLVEITPTIEED